MKFTIEVDLTTEDPRQSVEDVGEALRDTVEDTLGVDALEVEGSESSIVSEYSIALVSITHHR